MRELRDQVSRDGSDLDWRSGIRRRAQSREKNSFFSSRIKERPSPSRGFSSRRVFSVHFTVRSCSANVHSWRINRARPHAFNNDRHAYNRSERRVLPGSCCSTLSPLSARKARFAPRQTKASGTARKRDCHERDLNPASRKLCEKHAIFLCYFFRLDVCRNIFASEMRRILKGHSKQAMFTLIRSEFLRNTE